MRVLVTGAHGFVGHHVAVDLAGAGHEVIGTDRIKGARSDKKARVASLRQVGGIEFREADLSSFDRVRKLVDAVRPTVIVHIAAQYSVPYRTENMPHYVASNLAAFTYVCEAAALAKACRRIVYASSIAVADDGRPSGLYGATKAYNEHAAHAYSYRKRIETVGLRYGVVYGPMMRRDAEMYRTVRAFCRGEIIKRTSQLEKNVALIDIRDAAALTRAAACAVLSSPCHVLPAQADDERASYAYVARLCEQITGRRARLPADVVIPPRSNRIDQSRVRETLGFVPSITLEAGVRHYLQWAEKDAQR